MVSIFASKVPSKSKKIDFAPYRMTPDGPVPNSFMACEDEYIWSFSMSTRSKDVLGIFGISSSFLVNWAPKAWLGVIWVVTPIGKPDI